MSRKRTAIPPYPWVHSMVLVTSCQSQSENMKWNIPEIKKCVSFKLCTVLSRVIQFWFFVLHPTQGVSHPFVLHIHTIQATCPPGTWEPSRL